MTKALIIVDIQNDFTTGGALEVRQGETIIPIVNQLQAHFDLVIATQDWHPKNHKSFASNHAGKRPFEQIVLEGLDQVLWPDHCIQGTPGAAFHPALNLNRTEAIFRKGMDASIDSYSGFYDNGHRRSTGMAGYLRERGAQEVFICGLAGDYCAYYSAKDAISEGFTTFLIEDATRSIDDKGFIAAKADLKSLGGSIINSTDLL